jgi:6-phosphogluconolactonase
VDSEGLLKLVGHSATQQAPRDFAIDPTGKVIVVANQNSHSLITYSIGENGLLSKLKETYCGSPVSVLFA